MCIIKNIKKKISPKCLNSIKKHAFGIKIKNMKVIKMVSMEKALAFFIEISSLFSKDFVNNKK